MYAKKTKDLVDLATEMQSGSDGVSIQEIMEHYNVSKRTAVRMKDAVLRRFPGVQENIGPHNVKRWFIPNEKADKWVNYGVEEVVALQKAIKLMKTKSSMDVEVLEKLLSKIKASMDKCTRFRVETDAEEFLNSEEYVFHPGPKIVINKEYVEKLRYAIVACKVLKIKYKGKTDDGWRMVYPYGLLYGNKYYLVAWHVSKNQMRQFDLSKITGLEIMDKYFFRDEKFCLKDFCETSFGVFKEKPFDVEWLFDKQVARDAAQYIFHPKQTRILNKDGTLTVKFKAGGALEMDWYLYTWGEHVQVIQPKDWKEKVKQYKIK